MVERTGENRYRGKRQTTNENRPPINDFIDGFYSAMQRFIQEANQPTVSPKLDIIVTTIRFHAARIMDKENGASDGQLKDLLERFRTGGFDELHIQAAVIILSNARRESEE